MQVVRRTKMAYTAWTTSFDRQMHNHGLVQFTVIAFKRAI